MIPLFIYSALTISLYNIYYFLSLSSFSLFRQNEDVIDPSYRIVNITKSFFLGLTSPYALYLLYCILFEIPYNIYVLYFISSLYASLDLSALIYNPHTHITTVVHHIVVQLFYLYGVYVDWNTNSISNLILIYAIFSTFAYLVNFRLAIRKSNLSKNLVNVINDTSLVIYFGSCFLNWVIQLYFLMTVTFIEHYFFVFIYFSFIVLIAIDDVKLIKYLKHQSESLMQIYF